LPTSIANGDALSNPIITLTTDYGTSDHLVGVLKGVILRILPTATVVDINHHVAPFDLLDGALTIGSAYPYFPARTVHVVVVDPGVGTARRPILVNAEQQYFVAPDNGVLSMVYDRDAGAIVRHITAEHYFQNPVSSTFHGRDVFAPVAAWLAKTWQSEALGEVITDFVRFALPRPKTAGATIKGIVLRVDVFGNLMTNLTADDVPPAALAAGKIALRVGGKLVEQFTQHFAQGAPGIPAALVGSSGFLEVVVNKGNASRLLGANRGAEVTLELGGGAAGGGAE
jgi:S-adenosyl-L-methionine hydrolase (adenosine-forming)